MRFDLKLMVAGLMIASMAYAARAQDSATEAAATSADSAAATARKAPDFSLKDADGKEHKLSDYKGKTLVLMWTNPGTLSGDDLQRGCPFIMDRVKQGTFNRIASQVEEAGGVFLAVNSGRDTTPEATKAIQDKFRQTYPTLQDPEGTVGQAYGAKTTPHVFVIDPNGNIAYDGALNDNNSPDPAKDAQAKDYVLEAVKAIKAGKTPEVTKTKSYGCGIKYKK